MTSSSPQSENSIPIGAELDVFHHSSPLSLRQHPISSPPAPPPTNISQAHDYNFSGAVYDEKTSGAESEEVEEPLTQDIQEAEDRLYAARVFSDCSSISSFPTSISQHISHDQERYASPRTPSKRDSSGMAAYQGAFSLDHHTLSPRTPREHPSPFRHPSSVRALQMRDEAMSETQSVLRHHQRSGSRSSFYSQRSSYSTQSSPTRRSTRSHRNSPSKSGSNLKTEFPLVLLHCTLLPPTSRFQPSSLEDRLIPELLPEEYKNRWIALQTKLMDAEITSRGVLIPHPRDEFDLLEERLLESLELEQPRIRHNHYFPSGGSTTDSGFESGGISEEETEIDGSRDIKCPDCGHCFRSEDVDRRWEIKVFAANGLMRAGAWAAVWQEMEKVDVEINVWLPEEVRQDLEAKLAGLEPPFAETTSPESSEEKWLDHEDTIPCDRVIHRDSVGLEGYTNPTTPERQPAQQPAPKTTTPPGSSNQDFWAGMAGIAKDVTRDRKNVAVGMLSLLVLLLALTGSRQPSQGNLDSILETKAVRLTEVLTTTITAMSVTTSTAIATVTAPSLSSSISPSSSSREQIEEAISVSSESPVEHVVETSSLAEHADSTPPASPISVHEEEAMNTPILQS